MSERSGKAGVPADRRIAVVGMACRVPGAADPGAFWRLLRDGADAVTPAPAGRGLPDGTHGGFLDEVDRFDAAFFGMSPREAAAVDPQQRLALELAWEALEHAGLRPGRLRGSRTGVFVGAMTDDYARLQHAAGALSAHSTTGLSRAALANRLSHLLGLAGPSLAVDTAQSSGLAAVHLAVRSLLAGESALALAGGVHLNLLAEGFASAALFGALSPDAADARCRVFDARANGYVRGEGGGIVVLKPLAAALADGDPVHGVILGSALGNGTGHTLTAPDPAAQERVIRAAYRDAGVDPGEAQYVELHGTGTPMGDPVEAAALGAALGTARRGAGEELVVGSVKTNIGHLEGAAGAVGLIKALLSLKHRELPASLHFAEPHPGIPLDELKLRVPTSAGPWPRAQEERLVAGVSSFGMGGANCHLVLADWRPAPAERERESSYGTLPWAVSGRSAAALRAQAGALAAHVTGTDTGTGTGTGTGLADLAGSLATTRSAFEHRAVVLGDGREALLSGLAALADGKDAPHVLRGVAPVRPAPGAPGERVAFLFSGQGSQRAGMGGALYEAFPAYAEAFDAVCAALDAHLARHLPDAPPLRDVVLAGADTPEAELLGRTVFTQPALFAVEVALYRLLERWGVTPDVLLGHSVGELAAAHVAGVLDLADAAALVTARGALMQALPADGAMAAIEASEAELRAALAAYEREHGQEPGRRLAIAALNGPAETVVSGDADAVRDLTAAWSARGRKTTALRVSHAFHSPHMDGMLDAFRRAAEALTYHPPRIPLVSDLTGAPAMAEELCTPDYWVRHVREAVRFLDGARAARAAGATVFVEIGPGATLSGLTRDCLGDDAEALVLPTLRRDAAADRSLLTTLGELHVRGVEIGWDAFFADAGTRRVELPTYRFQRSRHWTGTSPGARPVAPPETPDAPEAEGAAVPEAAPTGGPVPADLADLTDLVRTHTAAALGYDSAGAVSTETAFRDLGLDSYGATDLRQRLTAATGVPLPGAALFNHPTPAAMAALLHIALGGDETRRQPDGAPAAVPAPDDDDPVVVVGMACRYPGGVGSPEELWRLLREERDATGDFPADRGWDLDGLHDPDPDRPGTSYTARGGFLDDVAGFDAEFFGISPREALAMDPQQRLLLETSWEAVERAGIAGGTLRGSRTGVFVGATAQDYGPRMHEAADGLEGYVLTGTTPSVASGRIAYVLGLEGPAVTVDTACSSSLVALHLAAQSIRAGECETALAGGVTVLSTPGMFVEFSRQRGLSVDGRCRSFAAGADGTGWAEGVGVLVLERLSTARRHGRPVLAVVRGTAINQDGASNGLTAPNGLSQERVIRAALASAGLDAGDVDAVEAHGTGTELGDPIEAEALLATYGQGRSEGRPLWLGSVKSNIGHTQAAAGVAGIIKMVQAMRHGELPATLHVDEPTSHVDWTAGGVSLLTRARSWPEVDRPRRAAVSSFGVSGTNAHVILEQADEQADEQAAAEQPAAAGVTSWPLSARTIAALRAQAARLHDHLAERPALDCGEVAAALVRRTRFDRRAVVVGAGRAELAAGLEALAAGVPHEGVPHEGVVQGAVVPGKTVFVYPGQGSQWVRMGARLLADSPVFGEALAECARALAPYTDFDLLTVLTSDDSAVLEPVAVVQPALWAVMVALTRWWEHHGVRPDAVIGHSQGEIAAACVAGALSLDDAARVVAERSRALTALAGTGGMLSVALDEAGADALLAECGFAGEVSVAAFNGPSAVVVAGPADALDAVQEHCARLDVRHRRVPVTYASHTPLVLPLEAELEKRLSGIRPRPARIPFYSTVTGAAIDTTALTADYWFTNLRSPVRFHQTVQSLLADGYGHFLEPSPHPGLLTAIEDTADTADAHAVTHATLHRDDDTPHRLALALAHTHAHGLSVIYDTPSTPADLPTYPFQHQHLWLSPTPAATAPAAGRHLFLDAPVSLATSGGVLFTAEVSLATHPWLADHAVAGTVLLPGAAMVELALHAADRVGCAHVDELTLSAPLLLPATGAVRLQVTVDAPGPEGRRALGIHARPAADDEAPWTPHAEGVLSRTADAAAPRTDLPWPPPATPVDLSDGYPRLGARGYDYGPVFQGLRRLWRDGTGSVLFAEVALPDDATDDAERAGVHPALLDAALHAVLLGAPSDRTLLPFSWSGVRLHATRATSLRVRATRTGDDAVSLVMTDPAGDPVVTVDRLSLRPVEAERLRDAAGGRQDGLYRVAWTPVAHGPGRADHIEITDLTELAVLPVPVPEFAVVRAPAADPDSGAIRASAARALELVQGWLGDERFDGSRLVFVTGGAVAVEPGDRVDDLAGAALWGLLRSAESEFPGRFAVVDSDDDPASAAALPAALATREPQLALRAGRVTVPRLTRHTPASAAAPQPDADPAPDASPFGPDGTVLVTGGTGTLGALLARHLVTRHGVRHLRLVSRRGPRAADADVLRDELTALGATVTVTACDLTDPDAARELIDATAAPRPLTAVVHAAGVLDDASITTLTPERLDAVLAAKADSALALHRATAHLPEPPALVLFSSTTATLGTPGQANYAAANAFLDALAHHRPRTRSIGWGLWAEASGMTRHLGDAEIRRMARNGVAPLGTDHALALFDAATRSLGATAAEHPPHLVAARLSLRAFGDGDAAVPAVLRDLVRLPARRSAAASAAEEDTYAARWAGMPAAEREREALLLVREQAAAVLGHDSAEPIEPGQTFKSLGFDSLTAVQLRNRLAGVVGRRLPTTLAFDYPTPHALTTFLLGDDAARPQPAQAAEAAEVADDPVVIVGMACRYPGGVASPEDLWRLVTEGREGLGPFPTDRGWDLDGLFHPDPDRPGTSHTRAGHFLYRAGDFDPGLFGLSRREALAMDPQQRLLLETSWEAFERAGIDLAALRGSRTGVFTGLMYHDYAVGVDAGAEGVEGHVLTGTQASVASGRVSYAFGLEGPAVTVDTACSSSLVALHLAAQSIRAGECEMALAGGVTVMASPGTFVEFSRQRGLSVDGRCRSFAAGADGTGWAEGVGVLVVERLSVARRNGHRVLAVVRGSAVNQDGASNGLTAPNGPSQQRVIRAALASAGLGTGDVDAVEAHGTGTTLGDPIEAEALLATYGHGRSADRPLWLGSVKSNIGHAQAAAGVAGIIKMVQALRHGELPATLHVDEPTPHVDWAAGGVALLTDARSWPEVDRPRRAAVSSFGVSGTNAHVILEQPEPEPEPPAATPAGPVAVPLSAQGDEALRAYAGTLHGHLAERPGLRPEAVAAALRTRARLTRHAVVVGQDGPELLAGLAALADGVPHPGVVTGRGVSGGTVFVYPGQGSQWVGMGARLLAESPVFADALAECARALAPYTDFDLLAVLTGDDPAALEPVEVVQPVLWAVMVALTRWWEHHGVRPDAVIGHSQGEIAAACVAGALSLDDAARVVAQRSQALTALAGTGAMLSVALDEGGTEALLKESGFAGEVSVAAFNGPSAVVVAGPADALDAVQEHCARHDVRHRRIPVTYASHTPLVQPLEADLEARLAGIEPRAADIPFYSTVTAGPVDTTTLTARYWFTNLRSPVRFHQTVQALLADGYGHFLEPSPHPGLLTAVEDTIDAADAEAVTHATLHRDDDTPHRLALALAHTHAHGLAPTLAAAAPPADLPTYPFQHEHLWLSPPTATRSKQDTLNTWRYTVTWRPHTPDAAPPRLTGTWLLLTPPSTPPPAALVAALEAAGAAVTTDPGHPDPAGILNLDPDPTATLTRLHERQRHPAAPLWTVTTHAVRATPHDPPPDPDHARTWGLGRVAALEYVRHFAGLIDLPADPGPHHYTRLVHHLAGRGHPDHEPHLAIRDDGGHTPRLTRAPQTAPPPGAGYRPRHATLVTGGTGALGPHIARWLVGAGAEHLVLVSRRGEAADGVAELVAEIEDKGARVTVAACDVADRDAVADLVRRLDADGCRIGTVIHAAAAMRLNSLDALTVEEFHEVVEAKVAGARHLDELLAHHPVAAFVLFSSIAGVWGSGDHGAYAAANAWLDAFAEQRRARGLPATSVAWGVWGSDTLPDAVDPEFLRKQGLPLLDPQTALAGLQQALDHDETFVALADVDWERFLPVFTSARPSPLLAEIAAEQQARQPSKGQPEDEPVRDGSPLARRLAGLAPDEREKELLAVVHSCLAAVLGRRPGAQDPADTTDKTPFRQRGMDSLLAVELRNRLAEATGLRLPATLVFEHPHPLAVARFLGGELAGRLADEPPAASVRAELARLEAAVTAHGVGAPERTEIAARLRSLLAGLDTRGAAPAAPAADAGGADGPEAADDDLDLVSDDEMFDLIDREFRDG
ncbi:type I polyketide synthase [Streptomyces sp. 184]|uniref:type I polyketide synthase n=1 Tax=Streptomyces sp. 184 TaxID=1827526 RepID=UPI003891273D